MNEFARTHFIYLKCWVDRIIGLTKLLFKSFIVSIRSFFCPKKEKKETKIT